MGQLYLTFKKVAVIFRQWRKFFSLTWNFYEVLISGPMTQGCSLHGAEDSAWHFTVLTHSWSVSGCPHTATAASVTNFSYSPRRHLALPDICCHPPWKPLFRFCCFCPECWFLSVCFMSHECSCATVLCAESTVWELGSLLPSCGSQRLNSVAACWAQAPLPGKQHPGCPVSL